MGESARDFACWAGDRLLGIGHGVIRSCGGAAGALVEQGRVEDEDEGKGERDEDERGEAGALEGARRGLRVVVVVVTARVGLLRVHALAQQGEQCVSQTRAHG